jgi:hypothetical protein
MRAQRLFAVQQRRLNEFSTGQAKERVRPGRPHFVSRFTESLSIWVDSS